MTDSDSWGRFEVRYDGAMVCFGNIVPRRVTPVEAGDLIVSLLNATAGVLADDVSHAVANTLQQLADGLRRQAQQQQTRGNSNDQRS